MDQNENKLKKRRYKQYLEISDQPVNVSLRTKKRWQKKFCFETARDFPATSTSVNILPADNENHVDNINTTANNSENICCSEGNSSSTESQSEECIEDKWTDEEQYITANDGVQAENINDENDEIMFHESGLTKKDVLSMVYGLALKHGLSNEARNDILKILKLCANLPDDEFVTSNYGISKIFDTDNELLLRYIFYCEVCKSAVTKPETRKNINNETLICPNKECQNEQYVSLQSENYFISVDTSTQIQSILSDKETLNNLQLASQRQNSNDQLISDVCDGEIYSNLRKKCIEFDLTYNFSTDGAPLFKSSRKSMWPIQLLINELPPKERFRKLIFAGLWVGKHEPNVHLMNTIMKSFVFEAKKLFEVGVTVTFNGNAINLKLLPLSCVVDSVARPLLQNRIQFNGYYGCSWCYHNGTPISRQIKYPVERDISLIRTSDSHRADLEVVLRNGYTENFRGVKGPCSLMQLPFFDIVWSFPVDYMHGVILGVVRQMWELWTTFSPENKHTYYIARPKHLKKINNRLLKIKPPHEIHRLPRSIVSEKAKWKASEWRSWLLFYALPCLHGILNVKYLKHFALLVKSIYNLLKENISNSDIEEAEVELSSFVKNVQKLYGERAMTFNVHSLLHLAESVRKTGPLWANSTFPFESEIFKIKQQVKGPVGVAKQIAKKMYNINTFLNIVDNSKFSDKCKFFCSNLWSPNRLKYVHESENTLFIGSGSLASHDDMIKYFSFSLEDNQVLELGNGFSYKRCIYNKILLHSLEYKKAEKTNDTIVQTKCGRYVQILKLLVYNNINYVFSRKIQCKPFMCDNVELDHIFEVSFQENDYLLLNINDIKRKCILLEISNEKKYLCKFPNTLEIQ